MKPYAAINHSARDAMRGFTLPELLVAMTVFVLLLGGVVFANLYGLSMFRVTETTLNATKDVRQTIGRMADEIRTCNDSWVGNIKNGKFEGLLPGEVQQGTSLQIQPTTATNYFITYFVKPSDLTFRRTTSVPGSAVIIAEQITNLVVFTAQDYTGKKLTNSPQSRVIHINLEFYQPRRHRQIADYYKLETSVTRHASELP